MSLACSTASGAASQNRRDNAPSTYCSVHWLANSTSRRSSSRSIRRRASSFSMPLRKSSLMRCRSAAISKKLDLVMTFGELSMAVVAVAPVLDVLEPVAVSRAERLNDVFREIALRRKLIEPLDRCLDPLPPSLVLLDVCRRGARDARHGRGRAPVSPRAASILGQPTSPG